MPLRLPAVREVRPHRRRLGADDGAEERDEMDAALEQGAVPDAPVGRPLPGELRHVDPAQRPDFREPSPEPPRDGL